MKSNNYGLHNGRIYKKLVDFYKKLVFIAQVRKYMLDLLGNFGIADVITHQIMQLTSLISDPACRLLEPTKIHFDFNKVSDRFCFDCERKIFIRIPK